MQVQERNEQDTGTSAVNKRLKQDWDMHAKPRTSAGIESEAHAEVKERTLVLLWMPG